MATYVEYELENGSKILIEADHTSSELIEASPVGDLLVQRADKSFREAFSVIREWALALSEILHDIGPDEHEVKFGVTVIGETGNIAVGKLGGEINYEVTLSWKKSQRQ